MTTVGGTDSDGDGYVNSNCSNPREGGNPEAGDDCDDNNAEVHPNATEVCNERNDDCDHWTDEVGSEDGKLRLWVWPDSDKDGLGAKVTAEWRCPTQDQLQGYSINNYDCDDSDPRLGAVCP